MAQEHLDRLSALDTSFLSQETENAHMHVGALLLFEGPPPDFDDLLSHIEARLHLVPRYRQKLLVPRFDAGRPLWVDDPNFNLEYHVRHTALPSPGSEDQLRRLAARIYSQRLDRSKPLWETWLVEGLSSTRFALIFKTHHALVDGVSGVDLATVLFDVTRAPQPVPPPKEPWQPRPEPSAAERVAIGARGLIGMAVGTAKSAVDAAMKPTRTLSKVRDAAEGIGEVAWAGLNPAPETPLNVPIGPHRRFTLVRNELAQYKLIKDTFGGTVNDVVLAVVSGGLARFLRSRGVRTEGLELSAQVPVSIRTEEEHGQLGNRLAAMRGPLPVFIEDPVARLRFVHDAMDHLKHSKQAVGADTIANMENFAPPTILAQASRLNFSTRLFNLVVTNVPGPQFPLYMLGREMLEVFPAGFLARNHGLFVAIMSYNGSINFGLLGDYDALPDLDDLGRFFAESLQELVEAAEARAAQASTPASRAKKASSGAGKPARAAGKSARDGKATARTGAGARSGKAKAGSKTSGSSAGGSSNGSG